MTIEETRDTSQPLGTAPAPATAWAAAVVLLAPVLLLGALIYHPYLPRFSNDAAVAEELISDPTRWGVSHFAIGLCAGLLVVALLVVADFLRAAGEVTVITLAVPFLVIGSVLFAFLPAMELGMLAVHEGGGNVREILPELSTWFVPIYLASAITFAIGMLGLALAVSRSRVLDPGVTRVVVIALVVTAAARFVPLGAALYVTGIAGVVALWPLAYRMQRTA